MFSLNLRSCYKWPDKNSPYFHLRMCRALTFQQIIQTSFHLHPLHKHRCHEPRPRLTPAPSASLFSHRGIFSKLFNTIDSIHRVEVSLKKSEGAQEQDEDKEKRKRLQCSQDLRLFLWTINQDGVDRTGAPPSSWASLRGFGEVGVEWQHVPLLVNGTMEEHPALPEPRRPHRTPKVFHQHNTPSPHSPWSKKGFTHSDVFQDPWRDKPCVYVWDSFGFSKQFEWEFFQL